jgi:hypothetical protein
MTPIRTFLNQFRREEDGSVVVEAMLILPILIWCFMGTFVFFDAYRTQGANVKAAYVLGDIISRETEYISPSYMDSLFALQGFLVDTGTNQQLRVTVVEFTGPNHNNGFDVVWSQARGGAVAMTSANLDSQFDDYIPVMSIGDSVIITETWIDYDPRYSVGLQDASGNTDIEFREFVVTRPRYGSICWNSVDNGTAATATC